MKRANITVVGLGYVGLSIATLLAQHNNVYAIDTNSERVDAVNKRICPIKDNEIEKYFKTKRLNLIAGTATQEAYRNADFIVIATPTNYCSEKNYFDTSSVETVAEQIIKSGTTGCIVIKSTIPFGFTKKLKEKTGYEKIIFCPEFLRESKALYDNLYPSRIIMGIEDIPALREDAEYLASLLKKGAKKKNVPALFMGYEEAEAVKLFANTYLAMRVAFINELDTFAELNCLKSKDIINGICLDSRIGNHYNNPSFGYGGYCLPKDSKQLLANYGNIPQNIIRATVDANITRKKHIANMVLAKNPKTVGVYRLIMKQNSDNFRESSIFDIINTLKENGVEITIYEPSITEDTFMENRVIHSLTQFKEESDIIIANRTTEELKDVLEKVYSRDIFCRD